MKIQRKIFLPFTLLLTLTILFISLIAITLLSRNLEEQLDERILRSSEVLALSGFASNLMILERLKAMTRAEIVTFRYGGEIVASTIAEEDTALVDRIVTSETGRDITNDSQTPQLVTVENQGIQFRVAYRLIETEQPTLVALAVETSEIREARREITWTISLIAIVTVILVLLTSHIIARSITSPIARLAEATQVIATGEFGSQVNVQTSDEVGALADSFNHMSLRLADVEQRLVRTEKLALTGQLAARIAHDIRNPLSSIKMQAQLLRTKLTLQATDPDQELLESILSEIERVEWVIKELLDLASPGELNLESGSINDVVEEALRLNRARLKHLKIQVEEDLSQDIPPVMLDTHRLTRAVLNLILNAVEAMPGGGRLLVQTRQVENEVTIEICDTGMGLPPDATEKVFDPFFSTKKDGVGLGLVNTKNVVEQHSGKILLSPRDGRGTCAVIILPVTDPSPLNG